jgi:hypothetical protein
MVVMPALAKHQQSHQRVVATVVGRLKLALAPHVHGRVDQPAAA